MKSWWILVATLVACAVVQIRGIENLCKCDTGRLATLPEIPATELDCSFITHSQLREALSTVVCKKATGCGAGFPGKEGHNGGIDANMWATVVNRAGRVCAVAFSGPTIYDQWLGSRVIAAAKANTVNNFCLPNYAMSTANLFQPSVPGSPLYGLPHALPVHHENSYDGATTHYGNPCSTDKPDPMCHKKPGGTVVFGGGLGLYDAKGELVGGLGVSGDLSCADHAIAWKTRSMLGLDYVPDGAGKKGAEDNIIYPETAQFGHPVCTSQSKTVAHELAKSWPTKKPSKKQEL